MSSPIEILDPDDWDQEMCEATQAVADSLAVSLTALNKLNLHGIVSVLDFYDRLQDQLRTPVLIQSPEIQ